jgi:hypothetical protein
MPATANSKANRYVCCGIALAPLLIVQIWTFVLCGVAGHDYEMGAEPGTLFLHCGRCGHRSPGWALNGTPDAVNRLVSHAAAPPAARPPVAPKPVLRLSLQHDRARILPFTRSLAR